MMERRGKNRSEAVEGLVRYEYSVLKGGLVESAGIVCRIMSLHPSEKEAHVLIPGTGECYLAWDRTTEVEVRTIQELYDNNFVLLRPPNL